MFRDKAGIEVGVRRHRLLPDTSRVPSSMGTPALAQAVDTLRLGNPVVWIARGTVPEGTGPQTPLYLLSPAA